MSSQQADAVLNRILAGLALAGLALALLFALFTFRTYSELNDTAAEFQRSLELESSLLTHLTALTAMEATHNAMLVARTTDGVENYDRTRVFVDRERPRLESFRDAGRGTAEQVAFLLDYSAAQIAQMDRSVDAMRSADFAAAQSESTAVVRRRIDSSPGPYARAFLAARDAEQATLFARTQVLQRRLGWLVVAAMLGGLLLSVAVIAIIRRTVSRLAESRDETLVAQTAQGVAESEQARAEMLMQEMNHRIGNSLGMVSALLGLQRSQSEDADVRGALETARARVQAVATAHRRLRLANDMETTQLAPVLADMAREIHTAQPRRDIALNTDLVEVSVSDRDAVTLGVLMSELLVNAFKHAFAGRSGGTVELRTFLNEDGHFVLCVEDDGVGLPADIQRSNGGLGTSMIERMGRQYGGSLDYGNNDDAGAFVALTLPRLKIVGAPEK